MLSRAVGRERAPGAWAFFFFFFTTKSLLKRCSDPKPLLWALGRRSVPGGASPTENWRGGFVFFGACRLDGRNRTHFQTIFFFFFFFFFPKNRRSKVRRAS